MEKETKNVSLSCGMTVTICKRSWAQVYNSVKAATRAVEELEKAGISQELKDLKLVELRLDQRDKALSECVPGWDFVREELTVADIEELEKAVDSFSKPEVVAGN